MTPYTIGSRAIYAIFGRDRRQVVTILDICPGGGARGGEGLPKNTPVISIKLGADGPVIETREDHLFPYKTPSFPPGITLNDQASNDQQDDIDKFMEGLLGEEEKSILSDMNQDTLSEILAEEGRDYSLLGISAKEMDEWEDIGNKKENYHRLIAQSPQGSGPYLIPPHYDWATSPNGTWKHLTPMTHRNGFSSYMDTSLDEKNRIFVEATVSKKGTRYANLSCDYGKIFCDLKFTKFLPEVGEKVSCVVGIRGPESKLPLKCFRVIQ
jgi:hypothetical protein